MQYPYPRDTISGYNYEVWQQNEPVVSIHPSTCHGLDQDTTIRDGNTFNALDVIEIDLYGLSTHYGGHCSFWYSTDETSFTKIIDIADCSLYASSTDNAIQVLLPKTLPVACNDSCIFAWSFIPYKSQLCEIYMNCADIRVMNTVGTDSSSITTPDTSIIIDFDTIISNSQCSEVNNKTHFSTTFGTIKQNYTYNEIGYFDSSNNNGNSLSLSSIISNNLLDTSNSDYIVTIDESVISSDIITSNNNSDSNNLCANPDADNIDGIIDNRGNLLSLCGSLCPYKDSDGNSLCRCEDGQCCSQLGICGPVLDSYTQEYSIETDTIEYTPQFYKFVYNVTQNGDNSVSLVWTQNGFYSDETSAYNDYCAESSNQGDWRLIDCSQITLNSVDDSSDDSNNKSKNNDSNTVFTVLITILLVIVGIILLLSIAYVFRHFICKNYCDEKSKQRSLAKQTEINNKAKNDDAGTPPNELNIDEIENNHHNNNYNNNINATGVIHANTDVADGPNTMHLARNSQNIELEIDNEYYASNANNNSNNNEQLYQQQILVGEMVDAPQKKAPKPPPGKPAPSVSVSRQSGQSRPSQPSRAPPQPQPGGPIAPAKAERAARPPPPRPGNARNSRNSRNARISQGKPFPPKNKNKHNNKMMLDNINNRGQRKPSRFATDYQSGFAKSPSAKQPQSRFRRFMSMFKKEGQNDILQENQDDAIYEDMYDIAAPAAVADDVKVDANEARMLNNANVANAGNIIAIREDAVTPVTPVTPDFDGDIGNNNDINNVNNVNNNNNIKMAYGDVALPAVPAQLASYSSETSHHVEGANREAKHLISAQLRATNDPYYDNTGNDNGNSNNGNNNGNNGNSGDRLSVGGGVDSTENQNGNDNDNIMAFGRTSQTSRGSRVTRRLTPSGRSSQTRGAQSSVVTRGSPATSIANNNSSDNNNNNNNNNSNVQNGQNDKNSDNIEINNNSSNLARAIKKHSVMSESEVTAEVVRNRSSMSEEKADQIDMEHETPRHPSMLKMKMTSNSNISVNNARNINKYVSDNVSVVVGSNMSMEPNAPPVLDNVHEEDSFNMDNMGNMGNNGHNILSPDSTSVNATNIAAAGTLSPAAMSVSEVNMAAVFGAENDDLGANSGDDGKSRKKTEIL